MNTSELITSISVKGSFPDDNFFSTPQFLSILNDQMQVDIIPLLLRLNEEYFEERKDFTITEGSTYRIPRRAIGAQLRDVQVYDSNGNYQNLARLYEEDRASDLSGYYIKRNVIELTDDFTTGTLRLCYFAAPNTLVATTACAQITAIDTTLNQVTVSSVPSTFANGTSIDFIQNNNPFDVLTMDAAISNISGTTLTFSDLPDDLDEGDWIALATQSPVPNVPVELHPVLVQSALCVCLASKKDSAVDRETKKLEKMIDVAVNMLDPRVKSNDSKIVSSGLLSHFRFR